MRRPTWWQILVHHTASTDTSELETDDHLRFHTQVNRWRDIGYHFVVERVDDLYVPIMGRSLAMAGAHEPRANLTGIGVAFNGNFNHEPPPPEQLRVGAKLIGGLCAALSISSSSIRAHRDFKATDCPGHAFPLEELRDRVDRHLMQEGWLDTGSTRRA